MFGMFLSISQKPRKDAEPSIVAAFASPAGPVFLEFEPSALVEFFSEVAKMPGMPARLEAATQDVKTTA